MYLKMLINGVEEECDVERKLAKGNGCGEILNIILRYKPIFGLAKEIIYKIVLRPTICI